MTFLFLRFGFVLFVVLACAKDKRYRKTNTEQRSIMVYLFARLLVCLVPFLIGCLLARSFAHSPACLLVCCLFACLLLVCLPDCLLACSSFCAFVLLVSKRICTLASQQVCSMVRLFYVCLLDRSLARLMLRWFGW